MCIYISARQLGRRAVPDFGYFPDAEERVLEQPPQALHIFVNLCYFDSLSFGLIQILSVYFVSSFRFTQSRFGVC